MRRLRERRANGRVVMSIEVDEAHIVDVLTSSRRLSLASADDKSSIRRALEELLGSLRVESEDTE